MKSVLFMIVLGLASFAKPINAQNKFTLGEFINFANTKPFAKFDEKIRLKGYSFKESETDNSTIGYTYTKSVKIEGYTYELKFIYWDEDDGKPVITFITADKTQITTIRSSLDEKGFKFIKTKSNKEGEIIFVYESQSYHIELKDALIKHSDGDYNIQRVDIWRK